MLSSSTTQNTPCYTQGVFLIFVLLIFLLFNSIGYSQQPIYDSTIKTVSLSEVRIGAFSSRSSKKSTVINISNKGARFFTGLGRNENVGIFIPSHKILSSVRNIAIEFPVRIHSKISSIFNVKIFLVDSNLRLKEIFDSLYHSPTDGSLISKNIDIFVSKTKINENLGILFSVENPMKNHDENMWLTFTSKYKVPVTFEFKNHKISNKDLWWLFAGVHNIEGRNILNWCVKLKILYMN